MSTKRYSPQSSTGEGGGELFFTFIFETFLMLVLSISTS